MTEQKPDFSNRRATPRLQVDYDLQVDIEGENIPYTGMIKDISSGGLFITTDKRHDVGDVIQVRFTFPSLEGAVECNARVQWIRDRYSDTDMSAGIGVQFVDLPSEVSQAINAYIKDKDVPFYEEGF